MKNLFFILLIITFSLNIGTSQNGGARVYTGITSMTNQDSEVNPDGQVYSGYHIGADARLMSGTMSFLLGGRYTTVSSGPQEGLKIFGHDSQISILNGRVGLGYNIISFGELFRIRTKALASFDLILLTKGEPTVAPGYVLNDGWLGGVTGLGFDVGPFVLDIEYEFGVLNAYYKKPASKFNSLSVSAGFFF